MHSVRGLGIGVTLVCTTRAACTSGSSERLLWGAKLGGHLVGTDTSRSQRKNSVASSPCSQACELAIMQVGGDFEEAAKQALAACLSQDYKTAC